MQLSNQQLLPVTQAQAWEALNDTEMLKAAVPGCDSMVETEPGHYDVGMTAAIGPVKAKFKGKMKVTDSDPPNAYTLNFEGQGGAAGHGKGTATVRLEPQGHQTMLHYTATASVGGKIAQVGSRLVDMAAQKMASEFFGNFTKALEERYGPPPATPAAAEETATVDSGSGGGAIAKFFAWLRRLFGGG